MKRHRLLHAVLLTAMGGVLAASCSSGPAAPDDDFLAVVTRAGVGLLVTNGHPDDRWFIAVERETAALLDLNLNPEASEGWTRIPAGESRIVPWERVTGYHAGARSAIVYSWIRSVGIPVNGGVQWTGEGFTWKEVPLR